MITYRKDIDGLRAIAVITVILFHFGFITYGYLGVDVFFVISGYLITRIIHSEYKENRFSILNFYKRRARRIFPLVLFICTICLCVGIIVMLPQDLENLSQSIIATLFFGNNIYEYIVTGDYWNIVNDYKPLMHTWSLGVEEQFYILYPFLFLWIKPSNQKSLIYSVLGLALISFLLFITSTNPDSKYYFIHYRFFEIASGCLAALVFKEKQLNGQIGPVLLVLLLFLLCVDTTFLENTSLVILVVLITSVLLVLNNSKNAISKVFLENKLVAGIGKISFSMYMWHQVLLAYFKYLLGNELSLPYYLFIFILLILLSTSTYFYIEQFFRDKNRISLRSFLVTCLTIFVLLVSLSSWIYKKNGIIRNVPELSLSTNNIEINKHENYNNDIFKMDKKFSSIDKIKVLCLGNSYARDWVNVLSELNYRNKLEITYATQKTPELNTRSESADIIFTSFGSTETIFNEYLNKKFKEKTYRVGKKRFGYSNGKFYNASSDKNCTQRVEVKKHHLRQNRRDNEDWDEHFIDIYGLIIDDDDTVPVFTENCKFISHDGHHFTQSGALYIAQHLETDSTFILNKLISQKN